MKEPKVSYYDPVGENPFPMRPLKLTIDNESVNIYIDNGDGKEPTHIAYWHADECEEDGTVMCSVATAIQYYYTDPQKLLETLGYDYQIINE